MSIAENIGRIEEQVEAACCKADRPRDSVKLMAVSKLHPTESILEAYAAGLRLFGENRVQEYANKKPALMAAGTLTMQPAIFHCIGPVQSNKAARAVQLFDAIDSVDSLHLAQQLNQCAANAGKTLPVSIEIKLSDEPSKHGLEPGSAEFDEFFEQLETFSQLNARGLMTVPPFLQDLEEVRPYFRGLRLLRDNLAHRYPSLTLDELSMGMSHDFAVAIEEGATVIRVGTAIFGDRPSKQ